MTTTLSLAKLHELFDKHRLKYWSKGDAKRFYLSDNEPLRQKQLVTFFGVDLATFSKKEKKELLFASIYFNLQATSWCGLPPFAEDWTSIPLTSFFTSEELACITFTYSFHLPFTPERGSEVLYINDTWIHTSSPRADEKGRHQVLCTPVTVRQVVSELKRLCACLATPAVGPIALKEKALYQEKKDTLELFLNSLPLSAYQQMIEQPLADQEAKQEAKQEVKQEADQEVKTLKLDRVAIFKAAHAKAKKMKAEGWTGSYQALFGACLKEAYALAKKDS